MMQISSVLMVKKKAVTNMAMKIGYIQEIDLQLNPQCKERFRFKEASFTRRISSRGDRVYSKMLALPVDYEEIVDNANIMKKNSKIILVREPFLLDDELRKRACSLQRLPASYVFRLLRRVYKVSFRNCASR